MVLGGASVQRTRGEEWVEVWEHLGWDGGALYYISGMVYIELEPTALIMIKIYTMVMIIEYFELKINKHN